MDQGLMDASQLDRLVAAIERNTEAQIEVAKATIAGTLVMQALADECVQLATMLVDPAEEGEQPGLGVDMAGRPIEAR
jgi:hypothetical protein